MLYDVVKSSNNAIIEFNDVKSSSLNFYCMLDCPLSQYIFSWFRLQCISHQMFQSEEAKMEEYSCFGEISLDVFSHQLLF